MNIKQFLNYSGSTTKLFKSTTYNYKIEVLSSEVKEMSKDSSGIHNNNFQRIVVIYLDNIPIMIALSYTNCSCQKFFSILQEADTKPIGEFLFVAHSGIKRAKMKIYQIKIKNIQNNVIRDYILQLPLPNNYAIYERKSRFTYHKDKKTEKMFLIEYMLPGLEKFLNKM